MVSLKVQHLTENNRDLLCCAATSSLGRVGEEQSKGSRQMGSTAFLLGVTALVVCKIATRIGVNAGHFEGLPRPTQID